jgi:hypothetical protein
MFKLLFYKNINLFIPLSHYPIIPLSLKRDNLLRDIPITLSNNFPMNLFKMKKTIIKTDLHTDLYQSMPLPILLLSILKVGNPTTLPSSLNILTFSYKTSQKDRPKSKFHVLT